MIFSWYNRWGIRIRGDYRGNRWGGLKGSGSLTRQGYKIERIKGLSILSRKVGFGPG